MNISFNPKPDTRGEWIGAGVGAATGTALFTRVLGPTKEIKEAEKAIDRLTSYENDTLKKIVHRQLPIEDAWSVANHNVDNRMKVLTEGMQAAQPTKLRVGTVGLIGAAVGFGLIAVAGNLFDQKRDKVMDVVDGVRNLATG